MNRKKISAIIAAVAFPFIVYFISEDLRMGRYLKDPSEINHKQVNNLEISEKDMKKDFEFLWRSVTEGIPVIEKYNEEYGLNITDSKERYWSQIENTGTELEYFCAVQSVLNDVPSVHTGFFFPDYELITEYRCSGYDIVCSDPYLKGTTELWNKELKNYYRESRSVVFSYADGSYYYDPGISEVKPDNVSGTLKTLGGVTPEEFIESHLSSYKLRYDDLKNKLYRHRLVFNDSNGEKITAEIEREDGTTVQTEVYYDLCDEYIFVLQPYLHGVYKAKKEEYEIGYTDETKDIVYIRIDSFDGSNGHEIYEKIKQYCFEDGLSVILDLRNNGGGTIQFSNDNVYSVLFSEDVNVRAREYFLSSYGNKLFFSGINGVLNRHVYKMNKLTGDEKDKLSGYLSGGSYFSRDQEIEYKGLNSHSPDVYILVSDETASAADFFVSAAAGSEHTVIIGDRTGGEKTGGQFMTMLPESRLVYCYNTAVCFNDDGTDNSLEGTLPDIRSRLTADDIASRNILYAEGDDTDSLKSRMKWDSTLKDTVNMINEKCGIG